MVKEGIICRAVLPLTVAFFLWAFVNSPVAETWPLEWGPLPLGSGRWSGDTELMARATRRVLEGQIIGAESFAFSADRSSVFTGTLDGKLLELDLSGDEPSIKRVVAEFGTLRGAEREGVCGVYGTGLTSWDPCGRVLSVVWDWDGKHLLLTDVSGVLRLDPADGSWETVLPAKGMYLNTAVPSKDGKKIWVTRASAVYTVYQASLPLFRGEPDGEVWEFDRASGLVEVLASGLVYPNGLVATEDEDAVIVCELGRVQLVRVAVSGAMKGNMKLVATNLPGLPDNIVSDGRGGVYVAFSAMRTPVTQFLIHNGWARKLAAGLVPDHLLPDLTPHRSGVLHLRENGEQLDAWYDLSGAKHPYTSEAIEWKDGKLLMGSYRNKFITVFDTRA